MNPIKELNHLCKIFLAANESLLVTQVKWHTGGRACKGKDFGIGLTFGRGPLTDIRKGLVSSVCSTK